MAGPEETYAQLDLSQDILCLMPVCIHEQDYLFPSFGLYNTFLGIRKGLPVL